MKSRALKLGATLGLVVASAWYGSTSIDAASSSGYDLTNFSLADAEHCPDLTKMNVASMTEDYYEHEVDVRRRDELPEEYQSFVEYYKSTYGVNIVFPLSKLDGMEENPLMPLQELSYFGMGIEDYFNRLNYPLSGDVEIRVYGYENGDTKGFHELSYDYPGKHIVSIFKIGIRGDMPIDYRFRNYTVKVPVSDFPRHVISHELDHAYLSDNPDVLVRFCTKLGLEYELGEGFVDPQNRVGFVWTDFTNYGKRANELHAFMMSASLYDEEFRKMLIDLGFGEDYK